MIDYKGFTFEEISFICNLIGENAIKDYLKKEQRSVAHYYRDCRISKLSFSQTINIVYQCRVYPFIWGFLNMHFTEWQKSIQKDEAKFLRNGALPPIAWANSLLNSPFKNQTKLLYKILDKHPEDDYFELLSCFPGMISRVSMDSFEGKSNEQDALITELKQQDEKTRRLAAQQSRKIEELEQHLEQVKNQLFLYQQRERQLQHLQIVIDYTNPDYPFLSLCRVANNKFGSADNKYTLHRLADIQNGELIPFERDQTQPPLFANRDFLYKTDGPEIHSYYGVWNWKADKNWNDPEKDHVTTLFNPRCAPIEIVLAPNCHTTEELAESLMAGISDTVVSNRMLWCFQVQTGYFGFLVDRKQLTTKGTLLMISPDILQLPVYKFSTADTLILDAKHNKRFMRRIDPGSPGATYSLYNPLNILRKILLDRASWSASRTTGISKSQWQQFRSFLEKMPAEGLLEEFRSKCSCSQEEAERYLSTLLSQADQYLDGQDLPTDTLIHAIRSSEKLSKYCAGLIRDEWEKQHSQDLTEARQELKRIQGEVMSEKAQLDDMCRRKTAIEVELREKESLAEGVEKRIADRIAAAKQDAAQFISDMAFCSSTPEPSPFNSSILSGEIQAEVDQTIIIENPDDLLEHMRYELGEAGVADEYSLCLAAFLYSAYCNKIPLLFAGPNAGQIADAFAVCMTGVTAAAVDCNQDYDANWVKEIAAIHTDIVAIRNPFRHDWIHPIIDQLESSDKFYLLLHPFAEDLCIEPAGLMNYVLPVLTEAFVSKKASGDYTGAVFASEYTNHKPDKPDKRRYSALIKKLFPQSVLSCNIQQILTDAHALVPEMNEDMDVLLGLIPAAYIVGKSEALLSAIEDLQSDTKLSQQFLHAIMGKDE